MNSLETNNLQPQDLQAIQSRIVDLSLGTLSAFAIPMLMLSLARIFTIGWLPVMAMHIVLISILCLLWVNRKLVPEPAKFLYIVIFFLLIGIGATFTNENLVYGMIYFFVAGMFTVIFYSWAIIIGLIISVLLFQLGYIFLKEQVVLSIFLLIMSQLFFNAWVIFIINYMKNGLITLAESYHLQKIQAQTAMQNTETLLEELIEAKTVAESASNAKTEFLANMSHEIRTPLSAVLGMANIGIRYSTDAKNKETFNHILHSGHHLLNVINDILDFSRIEAGKLSIESRAFQLIPTVENTTNMMMERARAKGLRLSVNIPPDLPARVLGDPLRLQQILLNLLSNAIKFTSDGEVLVSVSRDGEMTHFIVKDNGIGLNEDQISRLHTPFEQADKSTTRKFGGSGLGLAISYNLAQLMGGDISVESQLHEGSTFALNLPLAEIKAPVISESVSEEISGPQLEGLRVLSAEDGDIIRIILEGLLEAEGASVVFAENGQQAIDRLQEIGADNIDVVLMDVQMPVMDGYEATKHILDMAPELPIIGVTAHALKEEHDKGLAAGMVDLVTKPFEIEVLIATIRQHVDRFAITSKCD